MPFKKSFKVKKRKKDETKIFSTRWKPQVFPLLFNAFLLWIFLSSLLVWDLLKNNFGTKLLSFSNRLKIYFLWEKLIKMFETRRSIEMSLLLNLWRRRTLFFKPIDHKSMFSWFKYLLTKILYFFMFLRFISHPRILFIHNELWKTSRAKKI